MSLDIFKSLKFFLSKINILIRYKKQKFYFALKWLLFGKEISNFTYEIKNHNEIVDLVKAITNIKYNDLNNIIEELNPDNDEFKKNISSEYYKDFSNKNIFGRRMVWYLLVRTIKPEIVIESGVDKALGSSLLIYALYKNSLEFKHESEYIGIDIKKNKKTYFDPNSTAYKNFKFYEKDTLSFLETLNIKKKILYISDAEHTYDFEKKEYNLIKEKMSDGSVIISDNNSGALSDFSRKNNRNILFFKEEPKDTWYTGATTGVSYFY